MALKISGAVSKVSMTPALQGHPPVADILVSRAQGISRTPEQESVVIVAHGPSRDDAPAPIRGAATSELRGTSSDAPPTGTVC